MNKKILSILAITFCASCGLFAEDTIEAPAVEVVAPEETTACCGKTKAEDDAIACACGRPRKKNNPEASCNNCPPAHAVLACGCGCGNKKLATTANAPAARCGKRPPKIPVLACCGSCQEVQAEEVKVEEGTLAGCGCGRDKLVVAA